MSKKFQLRQELLTRLESMIPMPSDDKLSDKVLTEYQTIIDDLGPIVDETCITPLIQSFGYGDAFEVYWSVVHLLESLDEKKLRTALRKATRRRSWATDVVCPDARENAETGRHSISFSFAKGSQGTSPNPCRPSIGYDRWNFDCKIAYAFSKRSFP